MEVRTIAKQKIQAIVIRSVKYSERDKILTVFSREQGKISINAKGAMSAKSKFLALSQLFSYSEFIYSDTTKINYLTSGELHTGFFGIQKNIFKVAAASYIAESIDRLFEEEVAEEGAFQLLLYTLRLLETNDGELSLHITLAFILKLTGIYGIYPKLDSCIVCNKQKNSYYFDYSCGGLVCQNCKNDNIIMPILTQEESNYLHNLLYIPVRDIPNLKPLSKQRQKYLLKALNAYLIFNDCKSIQSFDLLYSL